MSLELNIFENLKYNGQAFNNENLPIVYVPFSFEGKISVYRSGDKYYGKLIWSKSMYAKDGVTSNKDSKNEDPKLRNRPLKDMIILNNLKYSDGSYSGGTVYDPKNGSTYKCNMKLHGDRLDIRGYIGISIIGRTSVWTRIK